MEVLCRGSLADLSATPSVRVDPHPAVGAEAAATGEDRRADPIGEDSAAAAILAAVEQEAIGKRCYRN